MTRDEKLQSLGYPLDRVPRAGAIYKPVVIDGTTVYVSGCVPFDGHGNLVSKGKVVSQVSVAEAQKAAALCAANVLRLVRQELGFAGAGAADAEGDGVRQFGRRLHGPASGH